MSERLPRPQKIDSDMWVDEAIWGHRLYDEQTPWLCFMEFLNVLDAEIRANRGLAEDVGNRNSLLYSPKSRLYLRHILFNSPQMSLIVKQHPNDNDSQWGTWIGSMIGVMGGIANPDLTYLRNRFLDFDKFVEVVEFVRSSTIEGENNKRWSSQFIFPYGPDCLYEDLDVKEDNVSSDRRFFARAGELLYLMLCRSGRGPEILDQVSSKILNSEHKLNRLVAVLQPPVSTQEYQGTRTNTYLPYAVLEEYRNLAEDWLCLFRCNLSAYDYVPYLVDLTGLHMIIYSLRQALELIGFDEQPSFVLEIVAPRKTVIRDLASESFAENNILSRRAVEAYINSIKETEQWTIAVEDNDITDIRALMKETFAWPKDSKDHSLDHFHSPEEMFDTFAEAVERRHQQHVSKFHGVWGREIGLSSRRGSRRVRYAPHDSLLKTLVLVVVQERMEFKEFLEAIYLKYGFIIGHRQAGKYIENGRADQADFEENSKRLEQRLSSMGLLKRLSDACAYVENPFAIRGTNK